MNSRVPEAEKFSNPAKQMCCSAPDTRSEGRSHQISDVRARANKMIASRGVDDAMFGRPCREDNERNLRTEAKYMKAQVTKCNPAGKHLQGGFNSWLCCLRCTEKLLLQESVGHRRRPYTESLPEIERESMEGAINEAAPGATEIALLSLYIYP